MSITCIELQCGATLVAESIDNVASTAINWLLPVGSAGDADDGDGHANLLSELIFRGAKGLSSREHSDALDRLGVQRSASVGTYHLRIAATCLGTNLSPTLELLAGMVTDPALDDEAVESVRSLSLQTLDGLEDDPQHLVMLRLRERHQPSPFNRHGYGERSVLESATADQLRTAWRERCRPRPSIISVAGAVDPVSVAARLDELLSGWSGACDEPVELSAAQRGQDHLEQETSQVHLAVAWDAPPEPDESSMVERLGISALSGGTSARLFTEVRQKRSLCYSVGASYRAGRDRGVVTLYAGTTPERAQETLEVCFDEIQRMAAGVTAEELHRAAIGLKSSLVMQGESTAARAAAIAQDQFRLGRPRTLEEVIAAVDAVSLEALNAFLADRRPGPFTIASIGPVALRQKEAATS